MICEAETLKSNEFVKRRVLRLQQVREQSKNLAKKIRGRVKDERGRILKEINAEKAKELEKTKQKNIEHLKSQLEEGLAQVGSGHSAAVFEDLLKKEWEVRKSLNRSTAIERGNRAAEVLRQTRGDKGKGTHHCKDKSKSLQSSHSATAEHTEQPNRNEVEIVQPISDTQNQLEPNFRLHVPEGGEDVLGVAKDKQQGIEPNSKGRNVVNERGDGDYNRDSVITANYFETSPNRECNDTLRKFYPAETIRQLQQISEQPPTSNIRDKQTSIHESSTIYSDVREPVNLHAMSRNNPFSTAISDHIKNRRLKMKGPPLVEAEPDVDDADDISTLRSLIQHTRYAPPLAPTIPKLPAGYKKTDDEDITSNIVNAGRKKSDLTPVTSWLPSSTKHQKGKSGSPDCKCKTCYCKPEKQSANSKSVHRPSNLRQSSSSYVMRSHNPSRRTGGSWSSVNNTVKYVPNRTVIRCKPAMPNIRITATKATKSKPLEPTESTLYDKQSKYSELPKHIRTYDEMSKTERNSVPDSNYMVERMSKEGKSAFELARDETREAEKRASERQEYYNDQARRIRGMQAAEKLQKEKEYQDVIKAIDNYEKEQRRHGKKLPEEAFFSEQRLKQKHEIEQRKMERAYEIAEQRQTKVHMYPGPITAPVVQPERRRDETSRSKSRGCESDMSSDDDGRKDKRISPAKKWLSRNQPPVVNVAEWKAASPIGASTNHNDLDEIPTRDSSDSTVKSIVVSKPSNSNKQVDNGGVMDVNRVLDLIEKQRAQLLKEVARMEQYKKPQEKVHKSPRKKKSTVKDVQTNSTTDDTNQVFVEKKKHSKRRSPSPKVQLVPDDDNVVRRANSNQQLSSGSQNSISFQGFQIVVEVKKGGKTDNKKERIIQNERSVQTTKSLLESQDSSTEVSIQAAKVVTTEKVTFQKDGEVLKSRHHQIDSSASTSYMSPPDRFTRQAVETYFGKRISLKTSETQTDICSEKNKRNATSKERETNVRWVKRHQGIMETPDANVFFNSESTINGIEEDVTRKKKKSTIKQCKVTRGVQVNNCKTIIDKTNVLQPLSQNVVERCNIDPKLKEYIHKLLEISKTGVNKIEIDVSDIPTPTSSIVNVTSNITPVLRQEYTEKVEKLKQFIDDNYSLLEQIEKEKQFHKNYRKNTKLNPTKQTKDMQEKQCPEISSSVNSLQTSDDVCFEASNKENRHVQSKKPKLKVKHAKHNIGVLKKNKKLHKFVKTSSLESCESTPPEKEITKKRSRNIETDEQDAVVLTSDIPEKPKFVSMKVNFDSDVDNEQKQISPVDKSKSFPHKDNVENRSKARISPKKDKSEVKTQSLEEQERNIQRYKILSDQCSQRIQNLSQMLEKVRKNKQFTLSSDTSPSSDEMQPIAPNISCINSDDFVPILSNIPKPSTHQYSEATNSDIPVRVWDYVSQTSGIQQVPPLNFAMFEPETPGKRPRPPVAMTRHSDIIQYSSNPPHELSTIIEVETPGHGRNVSSLSRQTTEASPISHKSVKATQNEDDCVNIQIQNAPLGKPKDFIISYKKTPPINLEADETDIDISPFISFQEFIKEHGLTEIADALGDTTLKANTEVHDDKSLASEETLPDIEAEMLKRGLLRRMSSKNNSSRNGSGENSSSDSAVYILQDSTSPDKKSDQSKKDDAKKAYLLLDDRNVPSISGIDEILQTSSNSSISENLMNDFQKALQSMGIHWAVSTLKKTKETMALSSSSSSVRKEPIKQIDSNKENEFINEFSNITGTSVGLSTLLADVNTEDNSIFKKYAEDLSNSSINKQMDVLLKRVAEIKKTVELPSSKSKNKKNLNPKSNNEIESKTRPSPNVRVNLFSEEASVSGLQTSKDKTQQRTSTPVKFDKLPSHSSSVASQASHPSNALFSNESDLSSVKNVSNTDKNVSTEEKDTLNVPDLSLKFGKMFESINDNKD